jgi:protocatechuate 3,4-dioxygenase alpha subunit
VTGGLTPSQTVGPFLHIGLPNAAEAVPAGSPGSVRVYGRVLDGAGEPVPDALVEFWEAGGLFARSDTLGEGFDVVVSKPAPLEGQAPHFAISVVARGLLKRVVTRMYFPDESTANAADPVLMGVPEARRATLVAAREGDGSLRFDIRLQGDGETVFFEP